MDNKQLTILIRERLTQAIANSANLDPSRKADRKQAREIIRLLTQVATVFDRRRDEAMRNSAAALRTVPPEIRATLGAQVAAEDLELTRELDAFKAEAARTKSALASAFKEPVTQSMMPGRLLTKILSRILFPRTYARVVRPAIADMQYSYAKEIEAGRPWFARWVALRGHMDILVPRWLAMWVWHRVLDRLIGPH